MASHYLRGDVWYLSWRENGKPFSKSTHSKSEKVAKFLKNELENRLALKRSPIPETDRLAMLILDEYRDGSAGAKKAKTVSNDHSRLRRYFTESNIRRLNQITESSLSRYISGKIKTADNKDGLTPGSCNAIIKNAKTFLNWAKRNNYLSENPLAEMSKYKEAKGKPRFFSKEEIKAILEASEPAGIGLFAMTAIYTGMRYSELARLTWGDIDFNRDEVTVQESKSGQFRVIPLHQTLKQRLVSERRRPSEACFSMPANPQTAYKLYLRRLERACTAAEIKDVDGWHTFRHTFASQLVMAGLDLVTVSKYLGHSKINTTMIYSHLAQEHLKEGIKRLSF